MTRKTLVEFRQVEKRFGDTVAVQPMTLNIDEGEFLAIMGSSGCGKTTTLRMLAGLEMPTAGEIWLDGERLDLIRPELRDTPMVWQSLALFPFLSVIRNVEFGLKMRGIDAAERRRRSMTWLERMDIAEFADRSVNQLSGGQRQRVALARALVTEPRMLLLDEPLSALDANLVVRMQGVLSRLQKELGITFVYVTHSQSEAFAMADRVVIMSEGRVEQVGRPQDVYRRPSTRFVAEFIGANNIVEARCTGLASGIVSLATRGIALESGSFDTAPGVNETVLCAVSADAITVSATTPANGTTDKANCIHGTLVSESLAGSAVTLLVETEAGEFSVQTRQRDLGDLELEAGTQLTLQWTHEDVYLLPSGEDVI